MPVALRAFSRWLRRYGRQPENQKRKNKSNSNIQNKSNRLRVY